MIKRVLIAAAFVVATLSVLVGEQAGYQSGHAKLPVGGTSASVGGVLNNYVPAATVSTGVNTTETDLWTYTVPANALNTDGQALRITANGSFGATANNKTLRIYVSGSALTTSTTASNNLPWNIEMLISRRNNLSTLIVSRNINISTVAPTVTTGSLVVNTANPFVIKITGQNGTAAASEINLFTVLTEFLGS